jgi:hypothetical protein
MRGSPFGKHAPSVKGGGGNPSQVGLADVWLIATHLHHDYASLEFSFGRAFEQLVNLILNLLTDLLLSTFLAYSARNILDFN